MKKNQQLNKVKKRLLNLSPIVKEGIEREANKDDFEALDDKELGTGGFGKVWKVRNKNTRNIYAIKVINKNYIWKENMVDQINREIEIMYKTDHPYIIKLYNHYEDDENFYLIMELAENGQLYNLLRKMKKLDEKSVAIYMKQIISSVMYLHSQDPPIIHRDIKPENILIDADNKVKLADFGWSNFLEENKKRDTLAGTPEYLAPEMVMKSGHDYRVDVWSLGVLIFELLAGRPPFVFQGDISLLYTDIKNLKIKWTEDFPILAKDLVSKILRFKPNDRISLEQALEHPWFKETLPAKYQNTVESNELNKDTSKLKLCFMTFKKEERRPSNKNIVSAVNEDQTNQITNNVKAIKTNIKLNQNNTQKQVTPITKNNLINSFDEDTNSLKDITNNKIKKIVNKKRESLRHNTVEDDSSGLEVNTLRQEIKIKTEEILILKNEIEKLKIQLKEVGKKESKFEEDESVLRVREQEKTNMLQEIESKNNKLLTFEREVNLLKNENDQIKREYDEMKKLKEEISWKKTEVDNENNDLKAKLLKIEEEKQIEMLNYEKKIRLLELNNVEKQQNDETSDISNISLKMQEMSNGYLKELNDAIKIKISSIEEKIKNKELTEVEFRTNLIENLDSKMNLLKNSLKENFEKTMLEEKKLFQKQIEDLNSKNESYEKNIEWYKSQINELFPFKQKLKLIESKLESSESMIKELQESVEILNYQNKNNEKLKIALKEQNDENKSKKELYKNAFSEAEKLFEKYSNGKSLRDMLNLRSFNDF